MHSKDKVYHIISIFQNQNGSYNVYGQGINIYTQQMEVDWLTSHGVLEYARNFANSMAASYDCILVETLKDSRQSATDVNEGIGIARGTS
ncbi:hypothetical protein MKX72_20265 [Priestia sp. FSL R5-0597]|uniref:hypothetical protein n=1 Tax=Priestia sp. FSL R5-0597 TaxID=2921580 RepID=UPI0030FAC277